MDADTVAACWNENAAGWVALSREGYDKCRDLVNTPGFLAMLPPVAGLDGLDLGCGEGTNTRHVARLGARMTGIDIAERMLAGAREAEQAEPLGIAYRHASMDVLPFDDGAFAFCMSTLAMMDCPDHPGALAEAFRVLKPGGFFQFSISHPATTTPVRYWIRDEQGRKQALAINGYFQRQNGEIEEWIFGNAPAERKAAFLKFKVPRFTRTISEWVNLVIDAGFILERLGEPKPESPEARTDPYVRDMAMVPYTLVIRSRKPA
ncbi:MAG: class I SAM-dependent methyltransferase [Opitutales bacterium]